MLFSRRKHGFVNRRNIFLRLASPLFRWIPMIAVFSLGVFSNHVYHKNSQPVLSDVASPHVSSTINTASNLQSGNSDAIEALNIRNFDLQEKLNVALKKNESIESNLNVNAPEDSPQIAITKEQNIKLKEQLADQQALVRKYEKSTLALKLKSTKEIKSLAGKLAVSEKTTNTLIDENSDLKHQLKTVELKVKSDRSKKLAEASSPKSRNAKVISDASIIQNDNLEKVSITSKVPNETKLATSRNTSKKVASIEADDVRIMKLKKGESLWNLSKRAYGKGHYFTKILSENPKITEKNFKRLRPGSSIRVPKLK